MPRSLALIVVAAGCTEVSVSSLDNDPPVAKIFSHRDGDSLLEGYGVTLGGSVSDDAALTEIVATWFVDDAAVCTGPLDPLGNSTCPWVVPSEDAVRVRFQAEDRHHAKGSALLDLAIQPTEPPTVSIAEPLATRRYYSNVPLPLSGTADDAEDAPDELAISWTSDKDGALAAADTAPGPSGSFASEHVLTEGRHALVVTATDLSGKTGTDSVTVDVGGPNHAPTCEITAPLDATESGQFNEVVFAAVVDDLDEPADRLSIVWDSDGTPFGTSVASINGDVNLPFADLPLGDHVITLTVTDDAGVTCTDRIDHAVVEPPTAPVVRLSPEDPEHNDDLVCLVDVPSVDPQGDPVSYVFEWRYDGVLFTSAADTFDFPGDTVSGGYTAPAQVWECSAAATDGRTTSSADTDSVTIATPTVVEVVVGGHHTCQRDTGDELTCWGAGTSGQLSLTNGRYPAIGAGTANTCAIDAAGAILCVGLDASGQTDSPGGTGWVGLTVSGDHACALDAAGAITCWGDDTYGQSDTSGLTGTYTQVATAFAHACAVRDDDGMDCWGNNGFLRASPTPGVDWSFVTTGAYHTCALDLAGLAICFGSDAYGESTPPGGTWARISAGTDRTCGVRGTGGLECWGRDTGPGQPMEPPPGLYSDVSVGQFHVCAVDVAGAVVCWGDDSQGQCQAPPTWW